MTYELLASIYTHGIKSDKYGIAVDIGEDIHLSSLNFPNKKEAAQAIVNTLISHYGLRSGKDDESGSF